MAVQWGRLSHSGQTTWLARKVQMLIMAYKSGLLSTHGGVTKYELLYTKIVVSYTEVSLIPDSLALPLHIPGFSLLKNSDLQTCHDVFLRWIFQKFSQWCDPFHPLGHFAFGQREGLAVWWKIPGLPLGKERMSFLSKEGGNTFMIFNNGTGKLVLQSLKIAESLARLDFECYSRHTIVAVWQNKVYILPFENPVLNQGFQGTFQRATHDNRLRGSHRTRQWKAQRFFVFAMTWRGVRGMFGKKSLTESHAML